MSLPLSAGNIPKFHDTLGALLIGYTVSCLLFGVLGTQTWTYFRRYGKDKVVYKMLVLAIVLIETGDQVAVGHLLYGLLVTNFADVGFLLGKAPWSIIVQVAIGASVATLVKICFAVRVWRFSRHNVFLTGVIMLGCFAELGLAAVFTWKSFELRYYQRIPELQHWGTAAISCGVFTDILIAGSLCFYLRKLRNNYHQNNLVYTLMAYAVNTGVVTSTVSIATLVLYHLMPKNFIFIGCYFVLSKLYAVSFIAALNTRRTIHDRGTERGETTYDFFSSSKISGVPENLRTRYASTHYTQSPYTLYTPSTRRLSIRSTATTVRSGYPPASVAIMAPSPPPALPEMPSSALAGRFTMQAFEGSTLGLHGMGSPLSGGGRSVSPESTRTPYASNTTLLPYYNQTYAAASNPELTARRSEERGRRSEDGKHSYGVAF